MITDTEITPMAGAGLGADYATGADAFMLLARIKQAVGQANAALRRGNCGAANEAMSAAWNMFGQYAPLAARTGQSPYATSIFKTVMAADTKLVRSCAETSGFGCGGLGCGSQLGMFEAPDPSSLKWLIGGGVAAVALAGILALRKG